MRKNKRTLLTVLIAFLSLIGILTWSTCKASPLPLYEIACPDEITIMGWNVENLFDTEDDPMTDDDEYTTSGSMMWNSQVVNAKLQNLTAVIRRVNNGKGPDILGLTEVENKKILQQLADHPNLKGLGYRYQYLEDGVDPRGIDVALISRYPAQVKWHSTYFGGRFILQADFNIRGRALHILVNHWRSRQGGKKKTELRRIQSAQKCYQIVQKILRQNSNADIAILGDFNDNPTDISILKYLKAVSYQDKIEQAQLYNITPKKIPAHAKISHCFDQIIVSRGIFDHLGFCYVKNSCQVIAYPEMCGKQGFPLRFSSFTMSGYSDHFPLVARFKIR